MKNVKPLNTSATKNYKQRVDRGTSQAHSHDPSIGKGAKPKETAAPKTPPSPGGAPAPKTPATPTPKDGGRVGGYGS